MNKKQALLIITFIISQNSTILPMLCFTKPLSVRAISLNRMYPMQKRAFGDSKDALDLFVFIGSLWAAPVIGAMGLGATIYGAYKFGAFLNKKRQDGLYKQEAYNYVRACSENRSVLLNEQLLADLDKREKGRLEFLLEMNKRYDQLCLVESLESQRYLLHKSDEPTEQYKQTFIIIDAQKELIYQAVCTLQDDMPHYQEKRACFYAQELGIPSAPPTIREKIAQEIKEQPLDKLIVTILTKHGDMSSNQKRLMAKE